MRIPRQSILIAVIMIVSACVPAMAQITLRASTSGGGGGAATDGSNIMAGTIGQPIIGPVTDGTALVQQGFWYMLPSLGTTGVYTPGGPVATGVALYQNVPNPFSTTTEVKFHIPKTGHVSLKLFDAVGHEIRTLVDGVREAGTISITVSGEQLESGYYTARLVANGATKSINMVVIR